MKLRELFVEIKVIYKGDGLKDATKDADKFGKAADDAGDDVEELETDIKGATRAADKFAREAGTAGRKLKQTGREADTAGRKVGKFDGILTKAAGKMASLGPALAAGGVAAGVAGVAKAVSLLNDKTAELDKTAKDAQKSGLGFESFQRLSHVATLAGTDITILGKGINKLELGLDKAKRNGSGPFSEALADLNLTIDDLEGKTPEEQLQVMARALEGVADEGDKATLAFKLMGNEGKELIPLFNSGADAIEEMVSSTGKIFTREDLAKAEAYQDALAELTKVGSDLAGEFAINVAPAAQGFVEWITESTPEVLELFGTLGAKLVPAFDRLLEAIQPLIGNDGDALLFILNALIAPFRLLINIAAGLANGLAFLIETGTKVLTWGGLLLDMFENKFPRAFAKAGQAVDAIIHPLDTARDLAEEVFDFIERTVGEVGNLGDKVRSVRASVGLGAKNDAPAATPGTKVSPAITAAFSSLVAKATTAKANAAAQSQAEQAAVAAPAAPGPRRRRGGGGGGGRRAPATAAPEPGLLEQLSLNEPGAVLAGRPPPNALTIIVAPIIKLVESMVINITAGPGERADALQDAANQARDKMVFTLADVEAIVTNMFLTKAKALQAAGSGGASRPGVG